MPLNRRRNESREKKKEDYVCTRVTSLAERPRDRIGETCTYGSVREKGDEGARALALTLALALFRARARETRINLASANLRTIIAPLRHARLAKSVKRQRERRRSRPISRVRHSAYNEKHAA